MFISFQIITDHIREFCITLKMLHHEEEEEEKKATLSDFLHNRISYIYSNSLWNRILLMFVIIMNISKKKTQLVCVHQSKKKRKNLMGEIKKKKETKYHITIEYCNSGYYIYCLCVCVLHSINPFFVVVVFVVFF